MMVPTIHLNGTGRKSLLDDANAALDAVRRAVEQVSMVYPNGRDYYPQGDRAIDRALAEHNDRVERLQSVLVELADLRDAISDGGAS